MKLIMSRNAIVALNFLVIIIVVLIGCNFNENNIGEEVQTEVKLNLDAPKETEVLGQLIGKWNTEQTILQRDGTWSKDESNTIWKWYYILEGHAIQDDWITIDSLNRESIVGTNIRIYNSEENQWYMAWIDKTNRRLATFTAINDNGTVIMDGINAKGRHIKNIFFNITENEFDWKQEWTFDDGKTWVEVTKIHCNRIDQ